MPPMPAADSPAATAHASVSASASEKHATLAGSTPSHSTSPADNNEDGHHHHHPRPTPRTSGPASAPNPKLRSCVICRRRKVRCDKASPCSNCRRANVACVFPSDDRPPRWARRLERLTSGRGVASPSQSLAAADTLRDSAVDDDPQTTVVVMERLRVLEGLVRELSGQLEQAGSAPGPGGGSRFPSVGNSPGSHTSGNHERDSHAERGTNSSSLSTRYAGAQDQFGRMVLKDANHSRYVSSGFWSRVDDELNGLKMDLVDGDPDSSEDEYLLGDTPSTQELDRTPSERHGFLFQHNLGATTPDSRQFRPLPSQIPFLLNTYAENVNIFIHIVHMPTITKMMREVRGGDTSTLAPANEALLFAMYYAAITSMEDDDVMNNFGTSKGELNLKFRLGLEHALAKADFLNVPDIVLIQAFIIFLSLLRRHESPRFVWMMVGLVIRMTQSLGLHRDGSHFGHLSPYEVEIRRRAWWSICMLDVRASEDQGTEYTIPIGSFDTKIPLNVNDTDIGPDVKEPPVERQCQTDMVFSVDIFKICDITRRMMSPGNKERAPSLDEQVRMVDELYTTVEQGFLRHSTEDENIARWVGITAVRLTMSKMLLMIYLPALAASTDEMLSRAIRDKLLVAAIEVAEYNHALNAEDDCRQWRWMYQTYTHWHSIVLLLIEIARRPLSPLVERAWLALHSRWLIPAQPGMDKKLQLWIPLRKLTAKARKHRDAELQRLQGDVQAIERLERADGDIPRPASSGLLPSDADLRRHWHGLVDGSTGLSTQAQLPCPTGMGGAPQPLLAVQGVKVTQPQHFDSVDPFHKQHGSFPTTGAAHPNSCGSSVVGQQSESLSNTTMVQISAGVMDAQSGLTSGQTGSSSVLQFPASLSEGQQMHVNSLPWIWADVDPSSDVFANDDMNMDVDNEADWLSWLESAKNMELNQGGSR